LAIEASKLTGRVNFLEDPQILSALEKLAPEMGNPSIAVLYRGAMRFWLENHFDAEQKKALGLPARLVSLVPFVNSAKRQS
jgi:hypothetical protein